MCAAGFVKIGLVAHGLQVLMHSCALLPFNFVFYLFHFFIC